MIMKLDNNKLIIIILVLAILILIVKYKNKNENTNENKNKNTNNKEGFRLFYESSPSTRNMSYDLRCEPIIPKNQYGIRNSSIEPHYRTKCLDIVSR
jgi:hypothetical protein